MTPHIPPHAHAAARDPATEKPDTHVENTSASQIKCNSSNDGENAKIESSKVMCASCGKERMKPQRCTTCKDIVYCGTLCQKRDWQQHKHLCQRIAEAASERRQGENNRSVNEKNKNKVYLRAMIVRIIGLMAEYTGVPEEERNTREAKRFVADVCLERMTETALDWQKLRQETEPKTKQCNRILPNAGMMQMCGFMKYKYWTRWKVQREQRERVTRGRPRS